MGFLKFKLFVISCKELGVSLQSNYKNSRKYSVTKDKIKNPFIQFIVDVIVNSVIIIIIFVIHIITRVLILILFVPPTRSMTLSCKKRSSLA